MRTNRSSSTESSDRPALTDLASDRRPTALASHVRAVAPLGRPHATMSTSDFVASLASTLGALSSAGPERAIAEAYLDTLLHEHTGSVLTGLAQLGLSHPDHVQRVLAFVLLRRFAFRPLSSADPKSAPREVWDLVDDKTRTEVQDALIRSLMQGAARKEKERGVICDVIAEVENAGVKRGGTKWPGLIAALTELYASPDLVLREALYRIYSECVVSLLESEPTDQVITGLSSGLRDPSTGVRIAALKASVNLIKNAEPAHIDDWAPLVTPMLEILPPLATEHKDTRLTEALLTLIDLASTPKVPARIFKPHLSAIITFALSILEPSPFKTSPSYSPTRFDETVRQPALELLVSIAETAPSMTKQYPNFSRKVVPALLDLMSEQEEDPEWLLSEAFNDDDDESMSVIAEGSLDRLSQALGEVIFRPFLEALTPMLNSPTWQRRHAFLSAIAAVAEGCPDAVLDHLTELKNVAVRCARDEHPRVRYAAVYAIGQLCTDMEGAVQEECGEEILRTLIEVARGREPRLQAFAAAALVNFFNSADVDLVPLEAVLKDVFEQLVSLLNYGTDWVKQNALEAMALLAAFMETAFTPLYPQIMPQLLNLLESSPPTTASALSLRARAIDCASQIAAAVDSSVAAPDATRLLHALHHIRLTVNLEEDSTTMTYLLGGFARLAETVGPETFAPFVEDCFVQLIEAAQKRPDMTITPGGEEDEEEDDEWETVSVDGDVVAIRTSALEEKADACHQLVILVQAISSILPPDSLKAVLQLAEPLLKFYFHVGVRQSAAALIAVSVQGLSQSTISQEDRISILNSVSDAFTVHIAQDTDPEFLATLVASWTTCYQVLPGCLSPDVRDRFIKSLEAQLTTLATRDHERRVSGAVDEDDALELDEYADGDVLVFASINGAVSILLTAEGQAFPIGPFLPFLALMSTGSIAPAHFALRLLCDIVKHTGEAAVGNVRPYLDRVLNALADQDPTTRRIAAFAVGVAAESAIPAYLAFLKATIEPLFLAAGPLNLNNNVLLAARDNAVSALSKIIRNFGEQVNGEALLPRWVTTLPVFVDGEEMAPVYSLLLELIARGHSSVSPSTDAATLVTKVLVSALENSDLPASLQRPMAQALKTYVSSIPPGGPTFEIPPHVEAKVVALLE